MLLPLRTLHRWEGSRWEDKRRAAFTRAAAAATSCCAATAPFTRTAACRRYHDRRRGAGPRQDGAVCRRVPEDVREL